MALLLVLVDTHEVEPILLLCTRLVKLNLAVSEGSEQTFVSNVAHAIQSKFGLPLLQQDRLHLDVVGFGSSTVVIDEARYLE